MRVSLGGCFPALCARIQGMPEAKLDPAAGRTGNLRGSLLSRWCWDPGHRFGQNLHPKPPHDVDVSEEYLEKIVSVNTKYNVLGQSFSLTKG